MNKRLNTILRDKGSLEQIKPFHVLARKTQQQNDF